MTEPSSVSAATNSVPIVDALAVAPAVPLIAPTLSKPLPNGGPAEEEEEDYTIKCVCDYQEDDGNTVLCEACETWQHIACYYHGTEAPGETEIHKCIDCEPRPIDKKLATEVQRARRLELDPTERKAKKPGASARGQKRKSKVEPVNGWAADKSDAASTRNGTGGSPREASSAKRPKAGHRASHSTTQIVPLKQPASARRSASASHALQSPSKATHHTLHDIESYSDEFMHLYDDDPGETPMQQNIIGNLKTVDNLSQWCRDPDAVRKDTNGKSHQEIFVRYDGPLDSMPLPVVHKQTKVDEALEFHGVHPKWVYLTVETDILRGSTVGELRGKIGHMHDYINDEANRWDELRHPLPFVFFHPALPIYIDTREQGTLCRYLRRSCQPTVHLKTFLENETDYRFFFVANKDLAPGSELTISWTPDYHVRKITRERHTEDKIKQESPEDEEYIREYFMKVLADFGGCACNDADGCAVRRYKHRKADPKMANGKSRRGRKAGTKAGQTNGRTTSSRSGSEALRYQDDDDADDARSTSASSRSKPHSRDMTPAGNELDTLGPDVDDRTKRKIAALEKQETDRGLPATKKKKRNSGGAALSGNAPASATRTTFPDGSLPPSKSGPGANATSAASGTSSSRSRYVDAATAAKGSHSPVASATGQTHARGSKAGSTAQSPTTPKPQRATYVEASVQCDMDTEASASKPLPRRPFKSLNKQLLERCHNERLAYQKSIEERAAVNTASPTTAAAAAVTKATSPVTTTAITSSPQASGADARDADGDVKMEDHTATGEPPMPTEKPRPPSGDDAPVSSIEPPAVDPSTVPSDTGQPAPTAALPDEPLASPNGVRGSDPPIAVPAPSQISTSAPALPHPTVTIPTPTNGPAPPSTAIAQSPVIQTPSSATPSLITTALNPLLPPGGAAHLTSSLVQPSPVKKKLSLGDYMSRVTKAEKAKQAEAEADKVVKSEPPNVAAAAAAAVAAPTAPATSAAAEAPSTERTSPGVDVPVKEEDTTADAAAGVATDTAASTAADATIDPVADAAAAAPVTVVDTAAGTATDKAPNAVDAMEIDAAPPVAAELATSEGVA